MKRNLLIISFMIISFCVNGLESNESLLKSIITERANINSARTSSAEYVFEDLKSLKLSPEWSVLLYKSILEDVGLRFSPQSRDLYILIIANLIQYDLEHSQSPAYSVDRAQLIGLTSKIKEELFKDINAQGLTSEEFSQLLSEIKKEVAVSSGDVISLVESNL